MGKNIKKMMAHDAKFIAPNELAIRWCCARTSVDRITRRAGMSRLYLGTGKNGIVRYVLAEVEAYEATCLVKR